MGFIKGHIYLIDTFSAHSHCLLSNYLFSCINTFHNESNIHCFGEIEVGGT